MAKRKRSNKEIYNFKAKRFMMYNVMLKLYQKKYPKTKFGIVMIDGKSYLMVYVWNNRWVDVVTPMEEAEPIAKEIADEYGFSYRNYADGRLEFCGYILDCHNVYITDALLKIRNN